MGNFDLSHNVNGFLGDKKGEYKTMKKCNDWLSSLADTSWEDEMEVVVKANGKAMQASKEPRSTDN